MIPPCICHVGQVTCKIPSSRKSVRRKRAWHQRRGRPAIACAHDSVASTASHLNVRDDRGLGPRANTCCSTFNRRPWPSYLAFSGRLGSCPTFKSRYFFARVATTPVHELERYMRYKDCSEVRGYPYKRSHLVALSATKISASDPPRRGRRARGQRARLEYITDRPFAVPEVAARNRVNIAGCREKRR